MIVFDTEIYSNYFLASFIEVETGKILHFEMFDGHPLNKKAVHSIFKNHTTVGFNSTSFDLPIIYGALSGYDNAKLKALCDDIILKSKPRWMTERDWGMSIPKTWDHIDIIDVAPGKASLKIYGGRLHAPRVQDLPIEPAAILTRDQMIDIRDYCENDLHTTVTLYKKLVPQIELREKMSAQYGMDLRSKSDAQIAETVIISELEKITGDKYKRQELPENYGFKYKDSGIVSFKTDNLKQTYKKILSTHFMLGGNGSVQVPDWLKEHKILIGTSKYQMGVGGLHSCEKSQYVEAADDEYLLEMDVASYYPNIILQQRLAPKSMSINFLRVYQAIVERRLKAKKEGDKVTADTLKIVVNSSFGHLGSKYSTLYAPDMLIQTTVTGQLCLLMLIERLEDNGISVVSANTDGVVIKCKKSQEQKLKEICFDWELDTSFFLERTDYKAMASRDVNNYLAVKLDSKTKGKGMFTASGLSKNPDFSIVYEAVTKLIATKTPIDETIKNCQDVTKFVSLRKVTGGAIWRDQYLGKAVRFYMSTEVGKDECISYAKNSNKVPKSAGGKPLMTLPDNLPNDIDYEFYIQEANDLLREVGVC